MSLALLLLAASAQPAASPATPRAAPAPVSVPRAAFIATMDAEFARMDTSKDGTVGRPEIEAFERATAAAALQSRAQAVFAQLDADHSGQLSLAEFARLNDAAPVKVDAARLLAAEDLNKDGKITLVEHRTAKLANFDRMDADKDGIVSPAEMKAAGLLK